MAGVAHLKSLQALEMAVREGSLKAAAARLGITPAAIGQRIRALEDHLGTVLLKRGPSGLEPGPALEAALPDLRAAFAALERASDALDLRRTSEIHIVADTDWAELWLLPRLPAFRAEHPNVLFNINGLGDVPMRLGAPDMRVVCGEGAGEVLFRDVFVAVTGPDNTRRMADLPEGRRLEGMPLLHMRAQREGEMPGWVEWCRRWGQRDQGVERGVVYLNPRLAIPAVRENIGFLVCGLSLCLDDIGAGSVVCAFPPALHVPAPHPYRMTLRGTHRDRRPQTERFLAWLRGQAADTAARIDGLTAA
ncbi:MAG: LysR family transcriptional regulator [Rhodobacter sp. CACIA14H1]|nr:MAG: LysR family transcriptional regulator [Rhodobacter sp. CACIA14H1]